MNINGKVRVERVVFSEKLGVLYSLLTKLNYWCPVNVFNLLTH